MKMKWYQKAAGIMALVMLLCLAGCGGKTPSYPELKAADISSMELSTVKNSTVEAQYPANTWIGDGMSDPLTIFYAETLETETATNINVQKSAPYKGKLTEKDMNDLMEQLEEMSVGLRVEKSEMRTFNGEPVIYVESVLEFNDSTIDFMIEQGVLTEESVAAVGGRDALKAIPPTTQMGLYAVVDGYLYAITGTYYDAAEKDMVLDTMTVIAQTMKSA